MDKDKEGLNEFLVKGRNALIVVMGLAVITGHALMAFGGAVGAGGAELLKNRMRVRTPVTS